MDLTLNNLQRFICYKPKQINKEEIGLGRDFGVEKTLEIIVDETGGESPCGVVANVLDGDIVVKRVRTPVMP